MVMIICENCGNDMTGCAKINGEVVLISTCKNCMEAKDKLIQEQKEEIWNYKVEDNFYDEMIKSLLREE